MSFLSRSHPALATHTFSRSEALHMFAHGKDTGADECRQTMCRYSSCRLKLERPPCSRRGAKWISTADSSVILWQQRERFLSNSFCSHYSRKATNKCIWLSMPRPISHADSALDGHSCECAKFIWTAIFVPHMLSTSSSSPPLLLRSHLHDTNRYRIDSAQRVVDVSHIPVCSLHLFYQSTCASHRAFTYNAHTSAAAYVCFRIAVNECETKSHRREPCIHETWTTSTVVYFRSEIWCRMFEWQT